MEHVNVWCFRDIYKAGLWEEDLDVCAQMQFVDDWGFAEVQVLKKIYLALTHELYAIFKSVLHNHWYW